MPYDNRREIRRQLEAELRRPPCTSRLKHLKAEFPAFAPFDDWDGVFRHLLSESVPLNSKDEILRTLIWIVQRETAPELNTVLLLAMWPALSSVAAQCQKWDKDRDRFWLNLNWFFLESVYGLGVLDLPRGIAGVIRHNVHDRLRTHYRREWSHSGREIRQPDGSSNSWIEEIPDENSTTDADRRALGILAELHLAHALREGHLSLDEFDLLMAVDHDGTPLAEYAQTAGISYDTAKKRRQRAIAKVRGWHREK